MAQSTNQGMFKSCLECSLLGNLQSGLQDFGVSGSGRSTNTRSLKTLCLWFRKGQDVLANGPGIKTSWHDFRHHPSCGLKMAVRSLQVAMELRTGDST